MNYSRITLVVSCILLSSCGAGEDPAAADVLMKMHDRMQERIMAHAVTVENPERAEQSATFALKIFPAADISEGTTSIDLTTSLASDVTDPKDPRADLTVALSATSDIPNEITEDADPLRVDTLIHARAAEKTLSTSIERADITAPMFLSEPFSLPAILTERWYGQTFAEFDAAHPKDAPISDILTRALRGVRATPEQLETFLDQAHLWKAVKLLPEQGGQLQIDVETDKKKIQTTVKAYVRYMQEISATPPSSDIDSMFQALTKNDAEFLQTMGSAKGVLSVDKETYDFRGFSGDIFDEDNGKTAQLEIRSDANGDLSISITDVTSGETFVLTRTGDDVRVTAAGKDVLKGTLTASQMNLTMYDPETGEDMGTASSTYAMTKKSFTISRGEFSWKPENVSVTVEQLSIVLSDSLKDISMKLKATGTREGKPLFSIDASAERKESALQNIAKPEFLPLENLQTDFLGALMPAELPTAE